MKIAMIAPSGVPFVIGGAEKMWWALQNFLNSDTRHTVEMIKLPSPENDFWSVLDSYRKWSALDLSHFDMVISGKYPAWMVKHPRHVVWQLHCLRGLYDCYHLFTDLPETYPTGSRQVWALSQYATQNFGRPDTLPGFFDLLDDLRAVAGTLPPELFLFPGPFIRDLVKYLDSCGLAVERIHKYATIANTVTNRRDYRPPGIEPAMAFIPTDLSNLAPGGQRYFLMVSRLDGAKRMHLGIEAMRHVPHDVGLKIVGTGPDEARLRRIADGDPRIEFLGFVNDADLERIYSDAIAVIFTPWDEDFGIITCEAMMAGKPVVTTTDAGGPTEIVRTGFNGYVTEPTPEALAVALNELATDVRRADVIGRRARYSVRDITWANVAATLLDEPIPHRRRSPPITHRRRRKLLVASTFPFYPPRGGGQARFYHMFKRIAADFDVTFVAQTGHGTPEKEVRVAPGLLEISIPKSAEQNDAEMEFSRSIDWIPASDIAAPVIYHLSPKFMETLQEQARDTDITCAAHPYLVGALLDVSDRPLWHDSMNVEYLLKRDMLPRTPAGDNLAELTREVEGLACREAELVSACSNADLDGLGKLYAIERGRMRLLENGVDTKSVLFVGADDRRRLRAEIVQRYGNNLGAKKLAVFLASWHGPNLEGVEKLMEIAPSMPDTIFVVIGSAGAYFEGKPRPDNVWMVGILSEEDKNLLLQAADFAVNPMPYGSGTNFKMLDYFASGIPVVTTAVGYRGLDGFTPGLHGVVAEMADFDDGVREMVRMSGQNLDKMAAQARRFVERAFDWDEIYQRFRKELPLSFLPQNLR